MFSKRDYFSARRAGVTVEVSLSIILSVLVLFLVIGLFSENLKTLAANCGLANFLSKTKTENLTSRKSWGTLGDATATQVNVQVVADQGLQTYIANAQAIIEKYEKTPPATKAELEELARAALILDLADKLTTANETLAASYNIYIDHVRQTTTLEIENDSLNVHESLSILQLQHRASNVSTIKEIVDGTLTFS